MKNDFATLEVWISRGDWGIFPRDNCPMKAISKISCHDNLLFENPLGDWPEYDFQGALDKLSVACARTDALRFN